MTWWGWLLLGVAGLVIAGGVAVVLVLRSVVRDLGKKVGDLLDGM